MAVFNRVHQYMDIQNMPWGRGEYQEETFNFISGFSFVLGRKKVHYHERIQVQILAREKLVPFFSLSILNVE